MTTVVENARQISTKNPYKFLEYFEEADQQNFAGRDREIREVVTGILRGPTFVLYGRSGLGKTSLLQAGVFPELRSRKHRPIYVRTLVSPISDLCEAIAAQLHLTPVAPSLEGLRSLLKAFPGDETAVLILDQFEEFFIRFRQDRRQREEFINILGAVLKDNALKLRVLFSLREDYLAQMEDFRGHLPSLFDSDYRLLPLSAFGTRQAVSQPLINAGIAYEQKLIIGIVDQLDKLRFDPPLLQVICTEICRQAVKRNPSKLELEYQDLLKVGGLDGIFRRYLNAFIEDIPSESHLVARTILDALITRENTKQAITLDYFHQAGFVASPNELGTILELLVQHGLVRCDHRANEAWYELLHERLVSMIQEWLDLDPEFFKFRFARDLIANCSKGEVFRENNKLLINEGQIKDVVGPYRERLKLNNLDMEFMVRSLIYSNRPEAHLLADAKFWFKAFGEENSRDLILAFFNDSDEAAKIGAACCATLVPDKMEGSIVSGCFDLALKDRSEIVRQTAGRSFAMLAGGQHLNTLMQALREKENRHNALYILSDMHQIGRSMDSINWFWRMRGKNTAQRRAVKKHRNDIHERSKIGALTGLLSGLAWTFTVGLCLFFFDKWARGDSVWAIELWIAMGMILPLSLGLGTLSGYTCARKAAKAAAIQEREGRWFQAIAKPGVYYWILTTILLLIGLAILDEYGIASHLSFGAMALVRGLLAALGAAASLGVLYLLLAALVRALRDSIWPGVAKYRLWAWAFIGSIGIPLFVPAIMLSVQGHLRLYAEKGGVLHKVVFFLSIFGAPLFSFLTFTISTSLAQSAGKKPIGSVKAIIGKKRWFARAMAMLACLGFTFWFGWMYGFDTIPFPPFARSIPSSPSKMVMLQSTLGPGVPDTDYYSIYCLTSYKVIKVTNNPYNISVSLNGRDLRTVHGRVLPPAAEQEILLGRTFNTLALTYNGRLQKFSNVISPVLPNVGVTIYRVRKLENKISADDGGMYYIDECSLAKKSGTDSTVWQATIRGELINASHTESKKISVYIPPVQHGDRLQGASLTLDAAGAASYNGKDHQEIDCVEGRNFLLLDAPVGEITPDPSGSWDLELTLTLPDKDEEAIRTSLPLIVLFKIAA